MDDDDVSESDDEVIYALTDPVLQLQRQIIERLSVYNYLKVALNVAHIVDNSLPADAPRNQKISLAVLVLDSIHNLRQLRRYHHSTMECLVDLADNPDKLAPLRRRVSWYQYIMSWVY